jgi:hypothetical protein
MSMQTNFVCELCELSLPQSPSWEEFCIHCNIQMLESDLSILKVIVNAL